MNVPFLVSNILSGVGMCAMLASTALRSRRKILAVQSVNHALSMAACSLLRGWSGAVQEAVNLVRDLAVLLFGKLNRFWQIFFVAAALGLGAAVTFAGGFQWYGLLPVLATALYSAVVVHPRCNARWIKASTAVCTMMWAVYSLFIRNYVYVLTNVITSASAVLFLLRSRKQGETTGIYQAGELFEAGKRRPVRRHGEKLHPERRGARQRRAVHHARQKAPPRRRRPI